MLLEQIKGQLAKFVPASIQRLLEQNPDAHELEKREEDVSVLFLDLEGYTRLSEQLAPQHLNRMIQEYFSSFLEIIRNQHGDVNETAGDGLMVIFHNERDPDFSDASFQRAFMYIPGPYCMKAPHNQ